MRRVLPVILTALAVAGVFSLNSVRAETKKEITIKEAMKEHKKDGLKDKALAGKLTDEEKTKLVELYEGMGKAKPPKGTDESWKKLCDALVEAAKEIKEGKDGALDKYKKAIDCGACHKAHKG